MAQEPREFEPLMISIERLLNALEGQADQQSRDAAAYDLRKLYEAYAECCCRRAHVIKDQAQQA